MSIVKVGIIGIGNMGRTYVLQLDQGLVDGARLTAVCGRNEEQLEWVKNHTTDDIQCYQDEDTFFNESGIDAVMIVTPHYTSSRISKKSLCERDACS